MDTSSPGAGDAGNHAPGRGHRALHPALEPMRRADCVALLEPGGVGRIAFHGADGLTVIPVNYCYIKDVVIFRTTADSAIAQCGLEPVAFEIDFVDEAMREGWSVLVTGMVRPATAREALAAQGLVEPWAGGTRDTAVAIEPHRISGRRIRT
jgi:nitroimidazol reductase NimA-like FMN-containing flavoprotein (pyridoxamine 5'-phosphate oxidase superfamily)